MKQERRLHPRLSLPLESHYCLDGDDEERAATILNLSAGGAALEVVRELAVGAHLDFRFLLPASGENPSTPILARAEVVRTERTGERDDGSGFVAGLKFVELGEDSFRKIQQFVYARLTKGRPAPKTLAGRQTGRAAEPPKHPIESPAESETGKLRRELARRTREFAAREERLKQQIIELTNREVHHQDRMRAAEASLATAKARTQELRQALAERDLHLTEFEGAQRELGSRLDEAQGAREALTGELDRLAAARREEFAVLQEKLETAAGRESSFRERIGELESESVARRRYLEELENQSFQLREEGRELRGQLDTARSDLERERKNSQEVESALRAELLRATAAAEQRVTLAPEPSVAATRRAEAREQPIPADELLLEPDPAEEKRTTSSSPTRRGVGSIAAGIFLGAAGLALLSLSPLGERIRSATGPKRSTARAAPVGTVEQSELRERLADSSVSRVAAVKLETADRSITTDTEPSSETDPDQPASNGTEATTPPPVEVVHDWARAWSEQRTDDYLAFYAADFIPVNGMDRDAWEAHRRDRIERPSSIAVTVEHLREGEIRDGWVDVVFEQTYEADTYRDRVRKTLVLVLQNEGWRIVGESTEPLG